ncbi:MAG: hypothetical protein LUE23_10110 [Lachnospiraceae bacterium]|nr:hypothetical protein [Lachnospiraceae bacterium]
MSVDISQSLMQRLEESMTERNLLRKLGLTKKEMIRRLRKPSFRRALKELCPKETWSCREILDASREILDQLSPEPEQGWLPFLYADGKYSLYPENFPKVMEPCYEMGKLFYMELLHVCMEAERDFHGFRPDLHFVLPTMEEVEDCKAREEFERFVAFCHRTYFLEFMRIGAEITPFNTNGHIAGVHFVSTHMARQMKACGVPVDLALMSGAAIGHDIGKFGCKDSESRRVPYLHYYYTDQCFRRHDMPFIGYIAANHSTWDLELENLSLESLLLIYADFRVKSTRENGAEIIHFYTLKESFDVILNKLDNVDDAKRLRYQKVYSKLVDFENYMVKKGVHTNFESLIPDKTQEKDTALLCGAEIMDEYKNMAISHNILLMHILSHESSFTTILESARSEKDWKNTRTYLNIFREYCTYMNQRQKLMTLDFLYELMMHREGDIRSGAATLMGQMIVNYDVEYRKEIPEGMIPFLQDSSSVELFEKYLGMALMPDHKLTEQHRKWLGYKMETLVDSVLTNCRPSRREDYLCVIQKYYTNWNWDTFTAFAMMNVLQKIPFDKCSQEMLETFLQFALHFTKVDDLELQVSILNFLHRMLRFDADSAMIHSYGLQILEQAPVYSVISVVYLKRSIGGLLRLPDQSLAQYRMGKDDEDRINKAFLENLKTATPWICKLINIHYLKYQMDRGANRQPVHTVTHLANLLTGTECSDVRHLAGQTVVEIAGQISHEQCNEVVMELIKGLELDESEFAKDIPRYLGQLIVYLRPQEMDEIILILESMLVSAADSIACVTLDTIGVLLQQYADYELDTPEAHRARLRRLWGLILRGLSHDHEMVAQEACFVLGEYVFGSVAKPFEPKCEIFRSLAKKGIHILKNRQENQLSFLINAAALNHIYRFISEFLMENESFGFSDRGKVAFFPGTFDPFTLSHKGIVEEIRKLGFEVYLAIDEFSWSKKTQPRLIRRRIASMSTAADCGVFMFPDEIPVNIANNEDLEGLRKLFPTREIYIVEGSDVTANASAYKKPAAENSIHHFNHIIFQRRGEDYEVAVHAAGKNNGRILGEVVELSLPMQLEDISSTRIRENIDRNRDIANLIDPMVQRYIYENNLYLREPQYKPIMHTRSVDCDVVDEVSDELWEKMAATVLHRKKNIQGIISRLKESGASLAILYDRNRGGVPIAMAAARKIENSDLYREFGDLEMVRQIRDLAWGNILLIQGIYAPDDSDHHDFFQLIITELLAHYLARGYTYCLYHSRPEMEERRRFKAENTLLRQGFVRFSPEDAAETVMAVDMHQPYVLMKNIETVIKEPLNDNLQVHQVVEEAHRKLQLALTEFAPGNLVISIDSSVMHHRLVRKITEVNQVPNEPCTPRKLGEKMCVPFGKVLRGFVTPNTVTKALHTEKVFNADMKGYTIQEFPNYSPLKTQLRTIRSFDRDVILVDDLLHKGYRLKVLLPLLREADIRIDRVITGVLTANGQDIVGEYGLQTDGVYFIPNITSWFTESTLYPFIGGDGVRSAGRNAAGLLTSVNLILPYAAPAFLRSEDIGPVYNLSMVCLENARDIMKVLEREYQREFERNLTLDRLSEVILSPTCPDKGLFMSYSENLPATVYIENDIQRLVRLQNITGYFHDFHEMPTNLQGE